MPHPEDPRTPPARAAGPSPADPAGPSPPAPAPLPDARVLRYHELAEAHHRILNPLNEGKLDLLGDICVRGSEARHLDLACGKGELLARWAQRHGTHGVGVDVSAVFLAAAAARADELGVADRVHLVEGDAAAYEADRGAFDIVSCLGATWIGGGLVGTLALIAPALAPGGFLVVGEPYWTDPPPEPLRERLAAEGEFVSLDGVLDRFDGAGFEIVEMVASSGDDWDRYAASRWLALSDWLATHPDDPDAHAYAAWLDEERRGYLAGERRYLGWGAFVARRR